MLVKLLEIITEKQLERKRRREIKSMLKCFNKVMEK